MRRLLKEMMILGVAFAAVVYMIFPTLGIFELIPDAIPVFGSMDEGAATLIILNTLRYYGFDVTNIYGERPGRQRRRRRKRRPDRSDLANQTGEVDPPAQDTTNQRRR